MSPNLWVSAIESCSFPTYCLHSLPCLLLILLHYATKRALANINFFLLSEFFFHFSDHFFSISFAGFSSCTHLKMLGVFPGSIQITAGAPDPQMSQVQHIQNLTFLMNSQSQLSTLHLGSQVRNSSHER